MLGSIIAALLTYGPTIFQAIFSVENAVKKLPDSSQVSSNQKLSAAVNAVSTAVPEIAKALGSTPDHSPHLENYISAAVQLLNATSAWAETEAAFAANNTMPSSANAAIQAALMPSNGN